MIPVKRSVVLISLVLHGVLGGGVPPSYRLERIEAIAHTLMNKMIAVATQIFEGDFMRLPTLISYDLWGGREQLGHCLMSEGYLNHVYDDDEDSTGIIKPEVERTMVNKQQLLLRNVKLKFQYNTIHTLCKISHPRCKACTQARRIGRDTPCSK